MDRPRGKIPLVGCPVEILAKGVTGIVAVVVDARDVLRRSEAEFADLTRHALATRGRGWHEDWYRATVKSGESYIEGLEASDLRLLDETMTRSHRQLSASGHGQKPASQ